MGVSVVQTEGGVQPEGNPHPVTHPGHLPHLGTEINICGCERGTGGGWSPAGRKPTPCHPPKPFAAPRYRDKNSYVCGQLSKRQRLRPARPADYLAFSFWQWCGSRLIESESSISNESGSGYGSSVLMTKNWKKAAEIFLLSFFDQKLQFTYS